MIEGMAPLDMSLLAPRPERLEQLCQELTEQSWDKVDTDTRLRLYQLAQGEQLTSAVGVLAQFCARLSGEVG